MTEKTSPESSSKGTDRVREEIVLCPDGPILVRGDFAIVSTTGEEVPRRRQTVALCRCGASGIKPYCDGTHKLIKFRTERGRQEDR
ncbi:CDGSH iron-sulfur domain-containing protein [Arthrobacter sp. H35-D1]|uniref:CDGSH iron-sulfur domain-containing protein n=1 Tax=Arthrobacter sp. H35-D1 TaxID=3046202 RepID=UPI0024B8A3EB|nr:CDGSH iron-sulfur domain-containing protein [Arthrobacter sp. H35-D1]MDJ0315429.1 CDGSH iron-sulfur domain-containing protein [Arthrobacter sp. H35-D1]